MKTFILVCILVCSVYSVERIRDSVHITTNPAGTKGGQLKVDFATYLMTTPSAQCDSILGFTTGDKQVKARPFPDSLGFADSTRASHKADTAGVAGISDTALNTPDSVRAAWKSDSSGKSDTTRSAWISDTSINSFHSDTADRVPYSGVYGLQDTFDLVWSRFVDSIVQVYSSISDTADVLRGEWTAEISDTADAIREQISDTVQSIRTEWQGDISDTADTIRQRIADTAATKATLGDDVNFSSVTIGNYYCSGALFYSDYSNGILGTTNIDTTSGTLASRSIDIIVSGNNYIQDTVPTNYRFKFLTTSGGFLRVQGITDNNVQDSVYLFRRQGKVCFWIPANSLFRTKRICIGNGYASDPPSITFTNEVCPTDTSKMVIVPFTKDWNGKNDGSLSGLDADLLDGYHEDNFVDTATLTDSLATRPYVLSTIVAEHAIIQSGTNDNELDTTDIKYNDAGGALVWPLTKETCGLSLLNTEGLMILGTGGYGVDPDQGAAITLGGISHATDPGRLTLWAGTDKDLYIRGSKLSNAIIDSMNLVVEGTVVTYGIGQSGGNYIAFTGDADTCDFLSSGAPLNIRTSGGVQLTLGPESYLNTSLDIRNKNIQNSNVAINPGDLVPLKQLPYIGYSYDTTFATGVNMLRFSDDLEDTLLDTSYAYRVYITGDYSTSAMLYYDAAWVNVRQYYNVNGIISTSATAQGSHIRYEIDEGPDVCQVTITKFNKTPGSIDSVLADNSGKMYYYDGDGADNYLAVDQRLRVGGQEKNRTYIDSNAIVMTTSNSTDTTFHLDDTIMKLSDDIAISWDSVQIFSGYKVLTDGSATDLIEFYLPEGRSTGGRIGYRIFVVNATPDIQDHVGIVTFDAANKAGTYSLDIDEVYLAASETEVSTSGTLSDTWSLAHGTNAIMVALNANTSLTGATVAIIYECTYYSGGSYTKQ